MSIVVPKVQEGAGKPPRGRKFTSELYPNIALVARKKSGKTVIIYNLLKAMIDKYTRVIIICPTHGKDATYRSITDMLDKKRVDYDLHTEIGEVIKDFVRENDDEEEDDPDATEEEGEEPSPRAESDADHLGLFAAMGFGSEEPEPEPENRLVAMGLSPPEAKPKKERPVLTDEEKMERYRRKAKFSAPDVVFVLDDLGEEMRNPSVYQLLKMNRHFRTAVLMSMQWPNNITPSSWKQLDQALLFAGHNKKKVAEMYKNLDPPLDEEEFLALYKKATAKKYSFLNYDKGTDEFREKFGKTLR